MLLNNMNTTQIQIGDGLPLIKELLKFREDAVIEQNKDITSLFKIVFSPTRAWTPSSTIMEELGVSFHGAGIENNSGLLFVILSTHKAEARN